MPSGELLTRRTVLCGGGLGLGALLMARGGLALAQESTPEPETGDERLDAEERERIRETYTHLWRATSPATHEGDEYRLMISNGSSAETSVYAIATIMDHRAHMNDVVAREELTLAPGESRELTDENAYGDANHFVTTLFTLTGETTDLEVEVTVVDSAGDETARFTASAFLIESLEELAQLREERQEERIVRRKERRERRRDRHGEPEMDESDHDQVSTPEA